MFKLLILILPFLFYQNISIGNEKNACSWDNRAEIPCLNITSNIPNSSKHSKSGLNKTIITKRQIIESGAVDVIDLLKTVTDINITQSGPKGQQASLFMRGTGSNHTLVMINGVPINDQSTTQGLHDFGVDFIQTIHQIEVYPGSSASHFGTNAIGGAINLILTGDYKDSVSVTADEDYNYELSTNKSFIFDNSSLNFKLGSVGNETISAKGNSNDEKDGVTNYSSNINYEYFLNEKARLFNTIYLRKTKAAYDNSSDYQTGSELQTGFASDNKMATLQMGLENVDVNTKNNYVIYYNAYDREYDERGTIDEYESEVLGIKYDFSKTVSPKISLGGGSEYKYDWGKFNNRGSYQASTKGHSENLSVYGNLGWNIYTDSNISFFARNDNHKQVGNEITYKVNFEQSISEFKVGLSYMNGIRNPTLYEMFGADNFGYSGNINLKPEKSNTYEIYSNLKLNEKLNMSVRAFKSNIKNNIEYVSNQYVNDADDVDLNQSGISSNIKFKNDNRNINFYSSLLATKKENGASFTRRPSKNYGLILNNKFYNRYFGNYNVNLNYNHYGKHFDVHSSTFSTIEMDSTDIIDLHLTKKINLTDYFLKISNVLDENYQRPHGYNQTRRALKLGLKF